MRSKMTSKEKNLDFFNLVQTQNLLDLELHELRPILYPKLLHLMEIEKLDEQLTESIEQVKSLDDFYFDENLIIKNRAAITRSLLDDRCIVGYILKRHYVLGDKILEKLRNRFFKKIRYSGKDYSKKLFNALLEHSLSSGKTIIIDKNIKLERVGQNTQWKIDFINFLIQNCDSSYEWLNHMKLFKLRELGLLTLRNHLNQQMIKQRRSEINYRLQQEVQNHLEKEHQKNTIKKFSKRSSNRLSSKNFANGQRSNLKYKNLLNVMDFSIANHSEEPQINFAEQNVQNLINELGCLQSFRYANHFFEFRELNQTQNFRTDAEVIESENYQLTNKFESKLNKRLKFFEQNELQDILEEKHILYQDLEESEDDEMAVTMPNYKQKNGKCKRWSKLKIFKRFVLKTSRSIKITCLRFLRRQTFNILIKFEEIQKQPILIQQLNEAGNLELSSPLPANVPYCQIGNYSLIAALKQFNWAHTQGPFIYNQSL